MAETVISDAARFPQDDGYPNISDGSESWGSAGHLGLLSVGTANGPFVYDGLTFSGHSASNDTVDVDAGVAVLDMSEGGAVDVQSGLGALLPPSPLCTSTDPPSLMSSTATPASTSTVSFVASWPENVRPL